MRFVSAKASPARDDKSAVSGRASLRVRIVGTAAYLSKQRIVIARAADVSLTGAFVATRNPDPLGTRAALRLQRGGEHIVAKVQVVRVSFCSLPDGTGAGVGMRFTKLTPAHRKFLARSVANAQRTEEELASVPFSADVELDDL
jgi:hypothetical protein